MQKHIEQLKAERKKLQAEAGELSAKLIAGQTAQTDVAAIRAEAEAVAREEIEAQAHALATRKPAPDFTAKRQALAERLQRAYCGKPSPDDPSKLRAREQAIGQRLNEINSTLSETALQNFLDGIPTLGEIEGAARALMQAEAKREATKAVLLELATRFECQQKPALAHKCRLAWQHFCDDEKRIHVERSPGVVERLRTELLAAFDKLFKD